MTKIELAKQKMEAAREEMRALGSEALKEALDELMLHLPTEVKSIAWLQYTDYFNDGDSCNFGVRADSECMEFNGTAGYDLEREDKELHAKLFYQKQYSRSGGTYDAPNPEVEAIEKFLEDSEEFLEEAIGDHLRVIYHRADGDQPSRIETEDYTDHD